MSVDFPTAWAIQREVGATLNHDPNCSSVEGSNNGMGGSMWLCDCGAIEAECERNICAYGLCWCGSPRRAVLEQVDFERRITILCFRGHDAS